MVGNDKMSKPKKLACTGNFMGIQVIIVCVKFEDHASKCGDYDSYNPYNSASVQINCNLLLKNKFNQAKLLNFI